MARAMSSATSGVMPSKRWAIIFWISSRLWPWSSVVTAPGSISVTRMLCGTPSWRSDSLNAPTPNFVCVVDEHVETAELLVRAAHECVGLLLVGHVRGHGERGAAARADPLRERLDAV